MIVAQYVSESALSISTVSLISIDRSKIPVLVSDLKDLFTSDQLTTEECMKQCERLYRWPMAGRVGGGVLTENLKTKYNV